MLTGDLVRVRIKERNIQPSFVRPDDEHLLERAGQLCEVFAEAAKGAWTRARIDEAVADIEGVDVDHKLTRGLAKVMADRGDFDTVAPMDPIELRALVFGRAAREPTLARRPGPTGRRTAADVLGEVARELDSTPELLSRALYADLKDQQVLVGHKALSPVSLLHRYNLALVQAVLLKASQLFVWLDNPDPKRVRQLFRILKFHELMYRVDKAGSEVLFELDGPQSLLRSSTKYGKNLASFFPVLPLQTGAWKIRAEIRWGKRGLRKNLELNSESGLVSHYRDTGAWRSRTEQWFEERFVALDSGWKLEPGQLIDLGNQALLVPDFTFKKGRKVAHLDIVGFWRKGYLQKRLKETPPNVILAVSKNLAGEAKAALPEQVVPFAEVINANKVLERVEAVAR